LNLHLESSNFQSNGCYWASNLFILILDISNEEAQKNDHKFQLLLYDLILANFECSAKSHALVYDFFSEFFSPAPHNSAALQPKILCSSKYWLKLSLSSRLSTDTPKLYDLINRKAFFQNSETFNLKTPSMSCIVKNQKFTW
jgi:hypothetical protein